jgi:heme/copper-type cytochrome/quinol oxidase subunit 4
VPFGWRLVIELALKALVLVVGTCAFVAFCYGMLFVLWAGAWFDQWWTFVAFACAIIIIVLLVLGTAWLWKASGRLLDRIDEELWSRADAQSDS